VTPKRQITLPQAVCQAMGLQPGDYVEVFARDIVAHIVKMNSDTLAGKFNSLLKGRVFPSTEEVKSAIKQRAAEKFLVDDCN
jgi:bifunctional DNA-binding transcriptional regulator/antitoxin component of YhaV-PrlF toxin-antitoxin module